MAFPLYNEFEEEDDMKLFFLLISIISSLKSVSIYI